MSDILDKAISGVSQSLQAFFHFIVANEVGSTGSHQCGFYIHKGIATQLFAEPISRGNNYERFVRIRWQDDFETDSRLIYYGVGTRNEYRLTRFGRGFPYLCDDCIGSMVVFARCSDTEYEAFILETEEDIEGFLLHFSLSPSDSDKFILAEREGDLKTEVIREIGDLDYFPSSRIVSGLARNAWDRINPQYSPMLNPDVVLQGWYNCEEVLFKALENKVYKPTLSVPFYTCEAVADFGNRMLNRRKARAGKALENHLERMFEIHLLRFKSQAKTEGKKSVDFLFPDEESYHNILFPTDKLVFLGAKTTCKDRWRQVLNEANRIEEKYLFTLQEGISSSQMNEMKEAHIHLVVPKMNIKCFPAECQKDLCSLAGFINIVKETQE